MKKLCLTILMLCLMLFCFGCSTEQEQEEPVETVAVYQALPLPDLFIEIPENYEKTSSKAYDEYYVCDDASIIITEDTRQKSYASAYAYSVDALAEYQKVATTLQFLSTETISTGCPYQMQTIEFNYTLGEGKEAARLTCLAGYMTDGHSMFIITCKSNTDTYPSHKQEFLQAMHSAAVSK